MCCFSRVVTGHSIQIVAACFVAWLSDPHDSSILKCITPIRMRVQGMPLYFYYVLLWAQLSNYLWGKYYCGLNFMPFRETSSIWPRCCVLGLVDMDLWKWLHRYVVAVVRHSVLSAFDLIARLSVRLLKLQLRYSRRKIKVKCGDAVAAASPHLTFYILNIFLNSVTLTRNIRAIWRWSEYWSKHVGAFLSVLTF
jgi:hypothetical protein